MYNLIDFSKESIGEEINKEEFEEDNEEHFAPPLVYDIFFSYLKYRKSVLKKEYDEHRCINLEARFNNDLLTQGEPRLLHEKELEILLKVIFDKFKYIKLSECIDSGDAVGKKCKTKSDFSDKLKYIFSKVKENRLEDLSEEGTVFSVPRFKLYVTLGIIFLILLLVSGAAYFTTRDSKEKN